jgi:endonuclease III
MDWGHSRIGRCGAIGGEMTQEKALSESLLDGCLSELWAFHGERTWEGPDDVFGVLIRTLLSHATTHANADFAFQTLLDRIEGSWEKLSALDVSDVEGCIRVAGLARTKAARIQNVLQTLARTRGVLDLEFLRDGPLEEAYAYLISFSGVGPKTARFTLMVALGADLFPMDTHIFRIGERLGFLSGRESDAAAHESMQRAIPSGRSYAAHMVMVEHGRKICHARRPECERCPIRQRCCYVPVKN